ncbi:MAG: hypothetical protein ABI186_07125 [Candidatus Elarobacter sp.]
MAIDAEDAGQNALAAALDWTKVSTGLATGALVFGVGLTTAVGTSLLWIRIALAVAWGLFFIAIVAGVFAQASLPVMMKDKTYDLEYFAFTWPARAHQVAFLLGVLVLATTLIRLIFIEAATDDLAAHTATQAVEIGQRALPQGTRVAKIALVELVKGPDSNRLGYATWHVQFVLRDNGASNAHARTAPTQQGPPIADVLIDADRGTTEVLGTGGAVRR